MTIFTYIRDTVDLHNETYRYVKIFTEHINWSRGSLDVLKGVNRN